MALHPLMADTTQATNAAREQNVIVLCFISVCLRRVARGQGSLPLYKVRRTGTRESHARQYATWNHECLYNEMHESSIASTRVSDQHLVHLTQLKHLGTINLTGTEVTVAGVERLNGLLPHTSIWDYHLRRGP